MAARTDYGVKEVADQLHESLRRYIEAQYPLRDMGVIKERHALLKEMGTIGQKPYIETTPTYMSGMPYNELGLPEPIGETLTHFAGLQPAMGVFPRPYAHQAQALKAFFNDRADLIVATGTGSGKTETFLLPILGSLLLEAHERPHSFSLSGCRALLLYPMNALVSDQVAKLRHLLGDERLKQHFRKHFTRFPRFGMYTSRTPYPGLRNSDKDREYLEPLLSYYLALEGSDELQLHDTQLMHELQRRGRWPAKDLRGFYGDKGKHWRDRLQTQPGDSELLTRHEMQLCCPDILVTNYSMLEYMLLRPVEREIFEQTRQWLAQDKRNTFLLVLDEAHMYRGVGGAEVAFLVRRLQARLGIPRERMRCILTSASLGTEYDIQEKAIVFAESLTGRWASKTPSFCLIQGQREQQPVTRPGTKREAGILADFDLSAFFQRAIHQTSAFRAINSISEQLAWPAPPPAEVASETAKTQAEMSMRAYLYDRLYSFGPLQCVIQETTAHARAFDELAAKIFPDVEQEQAEQALAVLLALGTYACKGERVLLPTRVHLFFRGLPPLYACIDPRCDQRRHQPGERLLLGRLYTEPRTHCTCASQARVYEIYSHRECGAAFLRVFGRGKEADFYWHEQGGDIEHIGQPLDETLLFLEEPHPQMKTKVERIWLDISTGRVTPNTPEDSRRYRECWRPLIESRGKAKYASRKNSGNNTQVEQDEVGTSDQLPFPSCPACRKKTGHKIVNLATKGEQPFANLVRSQFIHQPLTKEENNQYPNGGRKVLLFSDGRQKAARLARDLPREVEFDSFRQALILAVKLLNEAGYEAKIDERLYVAFVAVCHTFHLHFFDHNNESQEMLLEHIHYYQEFLDADLQVALDDQWRPTQPAQYKLALLRQLSDQYYSLYTTCAAVVEPSNSSLRQIKKQLDMIPEHHLRPVVAAWIQAMLELTAFDPAISQEERREIDEYFRIISPTKAIPEIDRLLQQSGQFDETQRYTIHLKLSKILAEDIENALYLNPSSLKLLLALDETWWQCAICGWIQHQVPFGMCVRCNSSRLEACPPQHPTMKSQKSYFLDPLRAVLSGEKPVHITAEEHTAQLSQRDTSMVYATTEEYELRFQDVTLGPKKPPIDVLSCTTTMEVGIDIGSLIAIGLRNVPPQRENYQQRAGRAGRRGTALSSVVTYAQEGPHDNYYYEYPQEIISGKPRDPMLKVDNKRLASRHIHSFLIQTFFHQQLDHLSQKELQDLVVQRPHVMSALGTAANFFSSTERFSLSLFRRWIESNIIASNGPLRENIVGWLPDELCSPSMTRREQQIEEKSLFVIDVASKFLVSLEALSLQYVSKQNSQLLESEQIRPVTRNEQSATLLDVLFDAGLLPSYAFPTDLCTFFVFDRDRDRVIIKERPQQNKTQALSEYAPGRLLVINKKTYRVGGVYNERTRGDISLSTMKMYVSCPQCTYVREQALTSGNEKCPICEAMLEQREMLDPPGFSPEGGNHLDGTDRRQQFSYASVAQFPTPIEPDRFIWKQEGFKHLRYTYEQNRRLVIVNKGPQEKGFCLCESCGAIQPEVQQNSLRAGKAHLRPFQVDNRTFYKRGMKPRCEGPLHAHPLYLGYSFTTDLLLLRFALHSPLSYDPRYPWLHDALRTMAEAISLAASRLLDIDPGELSANYRLVPLVPGEEEGAHIFVDLYLFDTASGGAGYAAEAGERLPEIINEAMTLLCNCLGNCERSCTKCLRHYGNRFWHERLDRHLAAQLLAYATEKRIPVFSDEEEQTRLCRPLKRFLELEGYACNQTISLGNVKVSLLIAADKAGKLKRTIAVVLYPALLERTFVASVHPLQTHEKRSTIDVVLLNAYVLTRDLPTAAQQVLGQAGLL